MAGYSRRERTVTTVEYVILADPKWGACWNQVQRAINAAVYEYRGVGPSDPWVDPADDVIRVFAGADEIIVSFEKKTKDGAQSRRNIDIETVGARLKMPLGHYRLHWKSGGSSTATVGQLHDGTRWLAASNWTSETEAGIAATSWHSVASAEFLNVDGDN